MLIAEMDRKQLRVLCKANGIKYALEDKRSALRALLKEKGVEGDGAPGQGEEPQGAAIPWSPEKFSAYYEEIVGKPHGDVPLESAYKFMLQVIEKKASEFEPVKFPLTEQNAADQVYSCLGLHYDAKVSICANDCIDAPLCARICKLKPELLSYVVALEKADPEVGKLTSEDVQDIKTAEGERKTRVKKAKQAAQKIVLPENKKGKAKPTVSSVRYQWVGAIKPYREADDPDQDFINALVWMKKQGRGGFTLTELEAQLTSYEDPASAAESTTNFLLGEGDIEVVK